MIVLRIVRDVRREDRQLRIRKKRLFSPLLPEVEKCVVAADLGREIRGVNAFVLTIFDENLESIELSGIRHRVNEEGIFDKRLE